MTDTQSSAGAKADALIATEVAIQDRMWGEANDRADAQRNQLLKAGTAQLVLTESKVNGALPDDAVSQARYFYPSDWGGLRDYGSNIANLVVAAAFIRSEIKRRLMLGEDTTRTKRGEPYNPACTPNVSADVAAALIGAERVA
jgi:hypothetical protein